MRSIEEWRLGHQDPDWESLKHVWGTGSKPVDPQILALVRPRIEAIQDRIVSSLGGQNPGIKSFRDVPPAMRDQFAQALVVATLQAFYATVQSQGSSPATFNAAKLPTGPTSPPQDAAKPPTGWTGN